jgi:hypothetical protein
MSFQEHIARELVGAFTENGEGHVIWLGESEADSVAAVSQFTRWAKARGRTNLPHLSGFAFHSVRGVQHLADMLNHEKEGRPRIVVFDRSRSLSILVPTDPWPVMLPLLLKLAPAQYLTVAHHGIRGVAPKANRAPYKTTLVIDEDFPAPPAAREGLRYRVTNVADGSVTRLVGQSVIGDLHFNLYEEKVPAL